MFREAAEFIQERAELWQPRMGLAHFEIDLHFVDMESDAILGGSSPKNKPGAFRCKFGATGQATYTACVETLWNYQVADVYFFGPSIVRWTKLRLDQVVVHEFSHILAAPEQYLLEWRVEGMAAEEEMTSNELDTRASLMYERMEMSTENTARAIYAGWEREDRALRKTFARKW